MKVKYELCKIYICFVFVATLKLKLASVFFTEILFFLEKTCSRFCIADFKHIFCLPQKKPYGHGYGIHIQIYKKFLFIYLQVFFMHFVFIFHRLSPYVSVTYICMQILFNLIWIHLNDNGLEIVLHCNISCKYQSLCELEH